MPKSIAEHCRLIVDPPAAGAWNMAVDEALLAAASDGRIATLRLYRWSAPTLSLGYFQRHDDRQAHAASRRSAVVRRQSGGGAILHDRELTYSLTLPAGHRLARQAPQLYTAVHHALVTVLASQLHAGRLDAPWELRIHQVEGNTAAAGLRRSGAAEPFLCFQRRAPGDVLLVPPDDAPHPPPGSAPGWKIIGSAQRRRGGALLQHGSVLLERSPCAPELPGWCDLSRVPLAFPWLAAAFPQRLGEELGLAVAPARLPEAVAAAARRIESSRYGSSAWTQRR